MNDGGKPPKTGSQLRSKLESISKTAQVVRHSGAISEQTDRQVIVASFFDHQLGKKFQSELIRREFNAKSMVKERKFVVTVEYVDVQDASAISEEFRNNNPDRRIAPEAARYDYLILGTAIGLASAMMFIVGARDQTEAIAFGIAATGFFTASGHFLDRLFGVRAKLGVWDFLVLIAVFGMALSAIQGIPLMLK